MFDDEVPLNSDSKERGIQIPNKGLTGIMTFYSLLKSMIVTGILYQPKSFYLGGVLFSSIACFGLASLTLVCMIWLSNAQTKYNGTYSEISGYVMGKLGIYLVDFMIVATQTGACAVNVGFIIDNSITSFSCIGLDLDAYITMAILLALVVPLCLLKTIREQSLIHIVADAIIIGNIFIIGIYSSTTGLSTQDIHLVKPRNMLYTLGTLMYGFENISIILPIKSEMIKPESFDFILTSLLFMVSLLFIWFGTINAFAYNSDINDLVTSNLPSATWVSVMLLVYLVAVLLSLPIMFYPIFMIIDKYLVLEGDSREIARALLVSVVVVAGTAARHSLGVCVSVIGNLFCSPLALIFPAIINLKLNAQTKTEKVLSWIMIIIGVILGLSGFFSTQLS